MVYGIKPRIDIDYNTNSVIIIRANLTLFRAVLGLKHTPLNSAGYKKRRETQSSGVTVRCGQTKNGLICIGIL